MDFGKNSIALQEQNNCFLIDWLTFVTHVDDVWAVKCLLGLDDPEIPWADETKFMNGYPRQCYWGGITISYGADQEEYYKDKTKVRHDMGICVNLSGTGCRSFETYGSGDWFKLFAAFFCGAKYNITRLDLAYDDHTGVLDIHQLEMDTRDRNYTSKAKYCEVIWSDNQNTDIQGMNIQIGSNQSRTKIRIYDKAAERGFKDRHWIRCEIQLRDSNAKVAAAKIFETRQVGRCSAGICRNYITYRSPSMDSNKSRWPVAPYWDRLVLDMERISLWITPGDPYNFDNTEKWLVDQCGQAIITAIRMNRLPFLIQMMEKQNPDLSPKYQRAIQEAKRRRAWAQALSEDDSEEESTHGND